MLPLHASTGFLDGIAKDHLGGALALLVLPLAVHFLRGRRSWRDAGGRRQLVACLLAATGLIHLGLVPGHLALPVTSALFLANGILFCGLSVLVLSWRWWRPAALLLLSSTILAYGVYVAAGWESVDDLGGVTKLIELAAFGLTVMPVRPGAFRWTGATAATLLVTLVAGVLAWGGILRDHGGALRQPPSGTPTAADQEAANQFAATTWADLYRYQDASVAVAAGYQPASPEASGTVHYENKAYEGTKRPILDPNRPQGLVYANTRKGPVLLGAMFVLPKEGQRGNDFNGAVGGWHEHPNACVSPVTFTLSGLLTPFGSCPPLSFAIITTPMLHVWRPDMPNGPYGELDDRWVKKIQAGQA
ncbi:MAG: hypothetical protein E6I85_06070 [Chloroflexi bacterium]|nr:MAG: hypothetical protein E6I85_06070 [Chloroflexota bacterium]